MGGGGGGGGIKWGGTHYLARIYFRIDLLNLFGFFFLVLVVPGRGFRVRVNKKKER